MHAYGEKSRHGTIPALWRRNRVIVHSVPSPYRMFAFIDVDEASGKYRVWIGTSVMH